MEAKFDWSIDTKVSQIHPNMLIESEMGSWRLQCREIFDLVDQLGRL